MYNIQMFQGTPVQFQDLGLFKGPVKVQLEPITEIKLTWAGAPIPMHLWDQIKAFMIWTQHKFHGEAQLRLFYNETLGHWKAVAMPQWISRGMTTNEIPDHPRREISFNQVPASEGWGSMGTVHHHCSGTAFQSGTDKNDEQNQHGLHITLGRVGFDVLDIHARASFKGILYDVNLDDWFKRPTAQILAAPNKDASFPKLWRRNMIERVIAPAVVYHQPHLKYQQAGYHRNGAYIQSSHTQPNNYQLDRFDEIKEWMDALKWPYTADEMIAQQCTSDDVDNMVSALRGAYNLQRMLDEADLDIDEFNVTAVRNTLNAWISILLRMTPAQRNVVPVTDHFLKLFKDDVLLVELNKSKGQQHDSAQTVATVVGPTPDDIAEQWY